MTDAEGEYTETLLGDAEIIEQVKGGDNAAFGALYERHATAARGLARQLLRGEAEVEDAVAEAFTKVLSVLQRGGGPSDAFRPYLLTAVRNAAYDRGRGEKRQVVTDDMESYDSGEPFVDPALEGLERSLIARAFLSLPERWQSVLWHTEIEGVKPAEAATILGMNANGVAALAYRAREGLRQAYLQMHLAGSGTAEACRPTIGLLGAYVRGGLAKRDTGKVDRHLDDCSDCREVYAELMDVNVGLRGIVLPLVVGFGATGYLASVPGAAASGAWWNRMSKRQQQATAGATAAACVAVSVALAMVGADAPIEEDPPTAAAPPIDAPAEDPPPPAADSDDPPAAPPAPEAPVPVPAPPADVPAAESPDPPPAPNEPEPTPEPEPEPEEPEAPEEPEEPEGWPEFAVGIDPVGSLVPGGDGILVLDVLNTGADTTEDVIAEITLPPGVEMVSSGGAGSAVPLAVGHGDWGCSAGGGGGECVRSDMVAGESSTHFLDVRVASDAEVEVPADVVVSSGEVRYTATGERGVSSEGIPARYATAGQVRSETVGNTLVTCIEPEQPGKPKNPWPWPWWERPQVPGSGNDNPLAPPERSPDAETDVDPDSDPGSGDADLRRAPVDTGTTGAEGEDALDDLLGEEGDTGGEEQGFDHDLPGVPGLPGNERPDGGEPGTEVPEPPETPEETEESEAPEDGYEEEPEEDEEPGECAQARDRSGERLDNDNWVMGPLDDDWDPTTTSSSAATWELPAGGSVRWAGLYFSAAGDPSAPTARIKGPGMASYTTITAADVRSAELPAYPAYQAFAEVTDLVRSAGGGQWWVGDVPATEGRGAYAGWSLMVILEDPSVEGHRQAMVLDETSAVFQDEVGARFPVSGLLPASVPARFDVVAWEGDAELGGDRVLLDGVPLDPHEGGGDAGNVFVSSARGSDGDPMTFGTDVVRFDAQLGRESEIRISSGQDALLMGAIVLTAPMRT